MKSSKAKEILALSDNLFPVATDLDYYGPEADESSVEDYEQFAEEYLSSLTGESISTYNVYNYSLNEPDGLNELRQQVWSAYLNQ